MSKPRKWLNDENEGRLRHIRRHIEKQIRKMTVPRWMTDHSEKHFQHVEAALKALIPDPTPLDEHERFVLLASSWVHDIGMVVGLNEEYENHDAVRAEHHLRSKEYVTKNQDPLGLTDEEMFHLAAICEYHRRSQPLEELRDDHPDTSLPLLTAYLRLADAISVDKKRVEDRDFRKLVDLNMPLFSRLHWLKSVYAKEIVPDPETGEITIEMMVPSDDKKHADMLAEFIKNDIREELFLVHNAVLRGPLPNYFDVHTNVDTYNQPLGQYALSLRQVLGNLRLHHGTASEVADTLVQTVLDIADSGSDPKATYHAIRDYRRNAVESIAGVRSCHQLLKRISESLSRHTGPEVEQVPMPKDATNALVGDLKKFQQARDRKIKALVRNARPLFLDEGAILLFSYSSLVLKALSALTKKTKDKTEIYVLECRSKTRLNFRGEVAHCDGELYASELSKAGFREVFLVPDLSVANLMARKKVQKVVIGANAIDLKTQLIGHTAGHRAVADLASSYEIPLFVVADSDKFGEFNPDLESRREDCWLSEDPLTVRRLKDKGVSLLNPREDDVRPEQVTMFITDIGCFSPLEIPPQLTR